MKHIVRILSAAAVLAAVSLAGADPLPIEQPGGRSEGFYPVRDSTQRRFPRRGVRQERRRLPQPEGTGEDAAPPAPASMPTDLSAPPHLPDDRETSLV